MEPTSSAIGLIVIVVLYVTIGVMSAAGSVYISRSIFSAKVEQIFFALFLIPIAGFYLAFTAYFRDQDAWQLEATAVAVFAVFGLVGVRVPFAVIIGYLLHIPWDAVHEFNAHAGGSLLVPRQITSVPLGVMACAGRPSFKRRSIGNLHCDAPADHLYLVCGQ